MKEALDSVRVVRKSFDGRLKYGQPRWSYVVDVDCALLSPSARARVKLLPGHAELAPPPPPRPLRLAQPAPAAAAGAEHVVVVGSGPAGLFCALSLVEVCICHPAPAPTLSCHRRSSSSSLRDAADRRACA
jgi:hypothetical protein